MTAPVAVPSATGALLNEIMTGLVPLVKAAVAAEKAGGLGALSGQLPAAIAEGQKLVTDVQAALPEIKAGYKTTEFWIGAGVVALIGLSSLLGRPLSVETDAVLAAVSTIYIVARSLIKKQQAAA
jgi:hypothetical protein